jgi:hypothetical protein
MIIVIAELDPAIHADKMRSQPLWMFVSSTGMTV